MPDIAQFFGNDLTPGPTGDLLTVDGSTLGVQRILRRLFTNSANGTAKVADYIWHLNYGAGLPARVGRLVDVSLIASVIRSQILLEAAVAKTPTPVITVTPIANGITVDVAYADGRTGQALSLSFDVSK